MPGAPDPSSSIAQFHLPAFEHPQGCFFVHLNQGVQPGIAPVRTKECLVHLHRRYHHRGNTVRRSPLDAPDRHRPLPDQTVMSQTPDLTDAPHTPDPPHPDGDPYMKLVRRARTLSSLACSLVACAGLPLVATTTLVISDTPTMAQSSTSSDDAESRSAKRALLTKLSQKITLEVEDQPIEDLFNFINDVTGAEIEPIYLNDDLAVEGIDPGTLITIDVSEVAALVVLERILLRAQRIEGTGEEYTWQFTEYGTIECGPKTRLNENTRIELYDVADLLYVVPDFDNAPEFDLQNAIQQSGSGGGGGTSSPFTGGTQDPQDVQTFAERAEALQNLITSTVEPDQWSDVGGDGGTITLYNQSFIITAPDYMHRQIAGYDFWPARLQQIRKVKGRQQVKIRPSTDP